MYPQKVDRRIEKTRRALHNALIELIIENGYESITVQHLIDRAEIGRTTFYAHFRDKEDVFRHSIENLRTTLNHYWRETLVAETKLMGELGFALLFFRHVDSHRDLYKAVVGRESGMIVDRHFRRMLAEMVRTDIAARPNLCSTDAHSEAIVQYIVGGLMSLLAWWIECEIRLSPEEVNALFLQLTLAGIDVG